MKRASSQLRDLARQLRHPDQHVAAEQAMSQTLWQAAEVHRSTFAT